MKYSAQPPFGPVHPIPIVHYSLEFACAVRTAFERIKPDALAVELPPTLLEVVQKGVRRLPEMSVVLYQNQEGETIYLPIEPADPFAEAIRSALEANIPVYFVDLDLEQYPYHRDYLPDTYAAHRLGTQSYYKIYEKEVLAREPSDPISHRREAAMAYRLQSLALNHNRILFVCGLAHVEGVRKAFALRQTTPLEKTRRTGITLFNLHPDDLAEISTEYPFLASVYEYMRGNLPPEPDMAMYSVQKKAGSLSLLRGGKKECTEEEALDASIRWTAHHLPTGAVDRQLVSLRLFDQAAKHYQQDTGEEVALWQKKAFFRFSRNYAMMDSRLVPDFFQLIVSARGCIDDNFCYALWRLGGFYPWQKADAAIPTMRMNASMLWLGTRKISIRKRLRHVKHRKGYAPQKRRIREQHSGQWLDGFDDPFICSYPPEDLAVENYGMFLRAKGNYVLASDEAVTRPLETSILDGIDIRETVRHAHEGKIYVKESRRVKGGVGSVVVIFDEEDRGEEYPFSMTWLGEHDQESDMAFYATDPGQHIVGPGISRCTYGGFVMTYPPRRLADVWSDPEYDWTQSKAERLLVAGLEYSLEKHVVYVAKRLPRSFIKQLASRWGKRIVYIPISQFSPIKLKKIRVLHVLAGKDKRELARDYIW